MASSSCIVLLVLLCVVGSALSINFNATYTNDCASVAGCSFFNASIWEGEVVPSAKDDVNITGVWTENATILFIYIDQSSNATTFKSLYVEAALFYVYDNNTVTINGSASINANATLHVSGNNNTLTVGSLTVVATGSLLVTGMVSAQNATLLGKLDLVAPLQVVNLVFGSYNVITLAGFIGTNSISILPEVTFNAPFIVQVNNFNAAANSTVNFNKAATITNQLQIAAGSVVVSWDLLVVGNPNATAPLVGNGSLSIQETAKIESKASPAAFTGSVFVDDVVVTLVNVILNNLFMKADSTIYAQSVSLPGSTTVNGVVTVINSLRAGELSLTGNLTVVNATLSVDNYLLIANEWSLVIDNAQLSFGGLVVGNIVIPTDSSFTASGTNATIHGNFENHGSLILSGKSHLNVFGNVILHETSGFSASLSGEKDAVLIVYGGLLALNGTLSFSIEKKPILKSVTYLVAESVNGTLNGTTFNHAAAHALSASKINRDLPIEYTISTVNIKYQWTVKDTQWWAWTILGVGIALVLVIIVAVVVKMRSRRANYQPVR